MAQEQRRHEDDTAVTSATQLRGLSWEGVRRTALDVVEAFCKRSGINPGEFMSNLGMMRSDGWKQGVNWRECVNWNQFNSLVFNAIPAEKEGGAVVGRRFEQGRLTRTLRDMRESFLANAAPRTESRTAGRPAAEQQETAQAPAREEQSGTQAPAGAQTSNRMSAQVWSRLYSATETVLDAYGQLNEDQRAAIQNIMARAGPGGGRRLVAVDLTSYLREMNGTGVLTGDQATNLYNSLVGSEERPGLAVMAENWMREERDTGRQSGPARMAAAEQREMPAPARTEIHIYRVTVLEPIRDAGRGTEPVPSIAQPARNEGGRMRTVSTFEVASPVPLESSADLVAAIHDRPGGFSVTRLASDGRRIRIQGGQLDLFEQRMGRLRFDPEREIVITEQQGGRPRT